MQWEAIIFQFKKINLKNVRKNLGELNKVNLMLLKTNKQTKKQPADSQDEGTSLTGGGGTGRILPGQIIGCHLGIFSLSLANSSENV